MATAQVAIHRAASTKVVTGGVPVSAMFGPLLGGMIANPVSAAEQGVAEAEALFIDLVGPAAVSQTATTTPLAPGDVLFIPAGDANTVSINAQTSGHRFSAVVWQPPAVFPPVPVSGDFPPAGPTSLLETIPSYLYQQYNDDDNLQAFVDAYNGMSQQYVDWFNQIGLPIYTGPLITGELLDWIAQGLYGLARPVISSGRNRNLGSLNTYLFNALALNARKIIGPQDVTVTSDDIFKRIITWHFFKGDGKVFNIRWLKRRIMRFLLGINGTSYNIDNTYQISVTFGTDNNVSITLLDGVRTVTAGAMLNRSGLNTIPLNYLASKLEGSGTFAEGKILKEAIDSGALELPFQFDYTVNIGPSG